MRANFPPVSPCGHAVDLLRRGYRTKMRFYANGPLVEVTWYKVPRDRPWVPFPTPFVSADWEEENSWLQLRSPGYDGFPGESEGYPRQWRNGRDPTQTVYTGHLCGTERQWAGLDMPHPPIPPVPVDLLGRPLCCHPEPIIQRATGGQQQGGVARQRYFRSHVGTGGQQQGGVARQTPPVVYIALGGQRQGGASRQRILDDLVVLGGQQQGGVAKAAFSYLALGGQQQGGQAAFYVGHERGPSGVVLQQLQIIQAFGASWPVGAIGYEGYSRGRVPQHQRPGEHE